MYFWFIKNVWLPAAQIYENSVLKSKRELFLQIQSYELSSDLLECKCVLWLLVNSC